MRPSELPTIISVLVLLLAAQSACSSAQDGDVVSSEGASTVAGAADTDTTWIFRGRSYRNLQDGAYRKGNIEAANRIASVVCGGSDGATCAIGYYVVGSDNVETRTITAHLESVSTDPTLTLAACKANSSSAPWGTVTFKRSDQSVLSYAWSYICSGQQLRT